nr:MAG TPA: hypothetical protein [Bacteriophage sp.]
MLPLLEVGRHRMIGPVYRLSTTNKFFYIFISFSVEHSVCKNLTNACF